jgi:hypothetical protein
MHFDMAILQTIPEHICEVFLSWTLCAYYVDPVLVSVIVLMAAGVGIFVFIRKKKLARKNFS